LVKPAKEVVKISLKKDIKVEVRELNLQRQGTANKTAGHLH